MSKKFLFVDSNGFPTEASAFEESDFIVVSAGEADAGKPIVLDAGGLIDGSLIDDSDISHNSLGGLQGGDTDEYYHLDSADHNTLTAGTEDASSLHNHDSIYYTETELGSNDNGEGASLIGIEDVGSVFTATNVEGALDELYALTQNRGVKYTVGAGGVTLGYPVFVSAADTASAYANTANRVIGLATSSEDAAADVIVCANDVILPGAITGLGFSAGDVIYWNGTALVNAIPANAGVFVWKVGIAKNVTDLHAEVEFLKRNEIA